MVLIEIALVLLAIVLFLITDSRVIHFATKDILKEYHIEYQKISGNLFTGIKVDKLKYENRLLLDQAIIHWNPFSLKQKKIHITQLELHGLRPNAIMHIASTLENSEKGSSPKLDFDIVIDKIKVTSRPLTYGGVTFKNFQLGTNRVEIDRELNLKSKLFNISVHSGLTDIEMRGKIDKGLLSLDKLQLLEIDPKVITSFIKEIKKSTKSTNKNKNKNTSSSNNNNNNNNFSIKKIIINKLFATMKPTTYGPITIDNTRVLINNIDINPNNHFNYNAETVTISADTSFASSTQTGFIKNSELFTTGEVLTHEHLFSRYSLPLNQSELYSLPVSLKLNHTGLWLDIEHSVKDLLVLESDFNINLDHAKHRMEYEYLDNFITIISEADGSTNYTNALHIKNIVDIDFRGESTQTTYHGDVTADSITNIPNFLSDTLLQNPIASYHGGVEQLLVNIDSDQISGSFLSQGYQNAEVTLESKYDIELLKLIPQLPFELQMAHGAIQSHSTIDFHNIQNSQFHIDLNSDIANISADMLLLKPYQIRYSTTIPTYSLLYNFDQKIKFSNLNTLSGEVTLGDSLHHIEINNQDLQLSFDYDVEGKRLNSGRLFINGESISFDGSLENIIDATLNIHDINSLSKTLMYYYDMTLPPIGGSADISIHRLSDNSISITLNSPYLSYDNFEGDINAKIEIDAYQNIQTSIQSSQISDINSNGNFVRDLKAEATINTVDTVDTLKNIQISVNSPQVSYENMIGDINAKIKIDAHKNIQMSVQSSKLSHEKFRADLNMMVNIDEDKSIHVNLNSRQISILEENEVKQKIDKLSTNFSIYNYGEEIYLNSYSFHLRNNPYIRHIFSNSISYLSYRNDTIYSKSLWVNDQIEVTGEYNIPTQKGKLKLLSDYFPYKDKNFDILSSFKLMLQLDKEKVFISGNIKLLGNKITYEFLDSGLSEDSDIIIVQEFQKKKESIINNIKAYVTIENETPIKYETKDIHLNLINEITVVKGYNKDIRLLGKTKIAQGYYMKEDKKFFLDESHIYFYGEPEDSILEIRANYLKDKYEIQIFISGSSSDPIINFSSNPYLTQREILSLILFDTTASNSGAGTAVYAMLGGTFAKELMKNLGISVDHLLLGEGIDESLSLEVGKKISDNITFILQHKNGRDGVKVKIDHNLNFETDIIIQPPNTSSIEFLYKSN
jgi:hypothetical protein